MQEQCDPYPQRFQYYQESVMTGYVSKQWSAAILSFSLSVCPTVCLLQSLSA